MKNDPVSYGIYIGEKILNAIKHCDSKQGEGRQSVQESAQKIGVVRRAVDFPSLMLSLGIKAAYVFYLSKSKVFEKGNQKKFYDIYQYIASTEDNEGRYLNSICGELKREEGAGYIAYLAILIKTIEEKASSKANIGQQNNKDNYQGEPLALLEKALSIAEGLDFRQQRVLSPYLVEIKTVLEAL